MLEKLFKKYKQVQFGGFEEPKCLDFILTLSASKCEEAIIVDEIVKECRAKGVPYRIWAENFEKDQPLMLLSSTSDLITNPDKDPLIHIWVKKQPGPGNQSFFSGDALEGFRRETLIAARNETSLKRVLAEYGDEIEYVACVRSYGQTRVRFGATDVPGSSIHLDAGNRSDFHAERSIRAKMVKGLEDYTKRIDEYLKEDGQVEGWKHGFFRLGSLFSFTPESRGINRHANYLVAKDLQEQLTKQLPSERKSIQDLFSEKNISQLREEKLKFLGLTGEKLEKHKKDGINSGELKAVINIARGFVKEQALTSTQRPKV